jgi:hypothetical protein
LNIARQLEQYTLRNPGEVLRVSVATDTGEEEIVIFKGVSSSLTRATDPDPDVPVIPPGARILAIDRFPAPFDPARARPIATGLTLADLETPP